jgi:hypothetical protein
VTKIVDTVTARRHLSTRIVMGCLGRHCGRSRRARCLWAGLVSGHHGGRAPGRDQRGHGNCFSIRYGRRPGALPGHGAGPFHRLHWYHLMEE